MLTFRLVRHAMGCALLAGVAATPVFAQREAPGAIHWYRGNTHTHTKNSDGDGSPDRAAQWYREHGYQFVVITDHEYLTPVDGLNATIGAPGRFLIMRGQEVTQWGNDTVGGPVKRAMHVNAINSTRVVYPMGKIRCIGEGCGRVTSRDVPLAETYRQNLAGIVAAGGIAQVNHPNGWWSLQPADLYGIPDSTLMEVWNGSSGTNNLGGADDSGHVSISTEALWDTLLTRGKVVWGVGSDDTHDYFKTDGPDVAPPGRGWVMVQADTLTPEAITAALHRGRFYFSNGVTLSALTATDSTISITVKVNGDARFRTTFIGRGGRVLAEVGGTKPTYRIRPDDGYVRAVIMDSGGAKAWTQPTFVRRR